MDLELINSYFQKAGYTRSVTSKLIFFRNEYEVRLIANEKAILIINKNKLIFKTGMPKSEASIVKWINLLISKNEKDNQEANSNY